MFKNEDISFSGAGIKVYDLWSDNIERDISQKKYTAQEMLDLLSQVKSGDYKVKMSASAMKRVFKNLTLYFEYLKEEELLNNSDIQILKWLSNEAEKVKLWEAIGKW